MSFYSLWGWITEHMSGGVLLIMGGILASLIQISPIKINPWSWLFGAIRHALGVNDLADSIKDVRRYMDEIDSKIDAMQLDLNERQELEGALSARRRILRFNDELLQDMKHSKEMFNNVLDDITSYTNYCETHKGFKNQKVVLAIENVKRVYQNCMIEHDFL